MSNEITESVLKSFAKCGLPAGSRVVVAFSGGPDSLCLLEVLAGLVNSDRLDVRLLACHVDHMLRPCSGQDAQFARRHAQLLGIPFELCREDVGAAAARERKCVEDAARLVRYRLLEETARSAGARAVATGHNLDDQAETVIMRLLRGTGLTGLAGIKPRRPISPGSEINLVRPLLEVTRKQILSYLKERNLTCLADETNMDTSYLRNRIRAQLLPLLEERYSPGVRSLLARLARTAGSALEALQPAIEQAYTGVLVENTDDSVVLKLPELQTEADFLLYGILGRAFETLGLPRLLTAARFELIAETIRKGRTSGRLQPGAGASIEFQGDRLLVTRLAFPEKLSSWEVELEVPGVTQVERLGLQIVSEIIDRDDFDLAAFRNSKSSREEALDADAAGTALRVRPVRQGDAFRPLGLRGTKKVSDFLIDRKVPLREKAGEAVVTAGGEIAWLLRRRLDARFAVTGGTGRVLLLSVIAAEGEDV